MNYNKKSKAELIELLKYIDCLALTGLEYCNDEEKPTAQRLGYARSTLKILNEKLNQVENEQK